MKNIIKHSSITMMLVMFFTGGFTQTTEYAGSKEKIYVQTNHVFFKPGEQAFFKIYLVNASDQTPSGVSNKVYVEVINPSGNVLQKLNYRVEDGYAEGSYDFGEEAVGGIYKLRAYTTWMQNEKDSSYFVKELTLQKVIAPRVLMKLDFPGKGYGAGDEVKADFSMRNLDDQPIKNYEGKFTVSIGGNKVEASTFRTNSEGKAVVKFLLPKNLNSNDGLLNISIKYDSYTEAISRSIPIVLNKIDLQLMPEGGSFIEGITTNIAFKALNENGKAADIKGEVWDNLGNKVTSFESYHFGMGKFSFTPKKGLSYTAKITSPANIKQQFELPAAKSEGFVMNVTKDNNKLLVKLYATQRIRIQITGQTKNITCFSKEVTLKEGENTVAVDEALFPAGIAQFTVSTLESLPLAERLCFLNENKRLEVKITTNKNKYLPREKVTMKLKTLDEKGNPVASNFSLSVIDDKLWSFADDKQDHILTWLLMSSELKGKVEEPQFYFKKEEPKAIPALDLVMLTHGYRYFDYTEFVKKEGSLKYTPDQDNILSGIIVNTKSQPVKAVVYLANNTTGGKVIQQKTSDDGIFFFSGIVPNNGYYLIAKPMVNKERVSINILQNGTGYNPLKQNQPQQVENDGREIFAAKNVEDKNKALFKKEQKNELPFNLRGANLEDVVVVGFGIVRKRDMTGAVAQVNAKEIGAVINAEVALQGKVAGLVVSPRSGNAGDAANIRIRGSRSVAGNDEPLFVLNGAPIDKANFAAINPMDIESIDVLKDAAATSVYGSRGANGVIVITSGKFKNERIRFNVSRKNYYATQFVQSNSVQYSVARRYYAPVYHSLQTEVREDFRENIYWNPVLQTDKDGNATVVFYNSDASTTFRAIAEGIGYNGKLGRAEATYVVQNAMSADAKIPPYLTVGDKALIPLVIKNNTEQSLLTSINISLPVNVKAGDYSKEITLLPGESKQVLIPVEATAATKGAIAFIVANKFNTETLSLPLAANEKGFPVIETFSGNHSVQHHFNVNKMVAGSLKTELKLFQNVEGQLLDGIESMLREPYGCFEQTSSSTYPNIYVLKYLRESGKSNPAIERKALDYIERGYKRLIGFETAKNGFEWFGKAPPHEALTAYGLLEFTDMQEFINVDKQMLQRTKEFLMSRRDGKGSFNIASGGYDQFASVPNKIANVYIVYALTQAGIGKEILPEYQAAVKQAMASNDGYQLAMMALAASNLKNDGDYNRLMEQLNTSFQKNKLQSETSVTNSREASLRVETMSLYAMALARGKSPQIGVMADVISKVLSEKSYYGYGSTQATVLALNAVVAYSKLAGQVSQNSKVEFVMNAQNVEPGKVSSASLKEGTNSFAVNYAGEKETIPYNLEVAYYTLTPPNSDKAELKITTGISNAQPKVGETVRMKVEVKNEKNILQPMAIAKVGIPAGLSVQPWQLKEIMEKNQAAYYEIFDNYLVFYWMGFAPGETKIINLDLKAEIAGTYKGKASNTYLYYTPKYKNWNDGVEVKVLE